MDDSSGTPRRIYLLGSIRIDSIPVTGEKSAALLAWLALNPQTRHQREVVADLLWPELPPERARPALSDLVYRLRKILGPDCLLTDPSWIGLNSAVLWTDVGAFLQLAAANDPASRREAIELYAGPLAPEVYMDWIGPARTQLQSQYGRTLERLGEQAEHDGQHEQALAYYQKLAVLEPLHEGAGRGLMRNLARLGRFSEALQAYHTLGETLQSELAVAPSTETRQLAEQIGIESGMRRDAPDLAARTRAVGRAAQQSAVLAEIDAALRGHGGLVAVEGEAGIGKTRLWQDVAASAQWRGATVVMTAATAYPTGSPLEPLRDLLNQALQGPRAAQVELLLPAETLSALGDLYLPWHNLTELPALPPLQVGRRLEHSLHAVVRTLTGLSPLVLIFDDMQWATPALWDALDALATEAASQRLLIGLGYRRAEMEQSDGWARIQRWEQDGLLHVISLGRLSDADVAAMMPPTMQAHAAAVAAVCGGNPFYVTQALDALERQRPLHTAGQILADRLRLLPDADLGLLQSAAVLGANLPLRLWSLMAGPPPDALVASADRLAGGHFLLPTVGGYAFAHDLIREAVYRALDPDERREYHDRSAAAWRVYDPDNAHAQAFHLDRAGQSLAAATAYAAAAAQDLALSAFAEARAALERALELWSSAPTDERILALFDLVQICDSTGDRARQQSALQEALQDAHSMERDSYVLQAMIGLGRLAAVTGEVERAAEHLNQAVALADQVPEPALQFDAAFYSGDLEARRGRLETSRSHFERALAHATGVDPLNQARALRGLSIVARLGGDAVTSMSLIEQALALQTAHNDLFGASVTQMNLLATLYDMGAWDRLAILAGDALAVKERLGDRHGAAIAQHMRGLAALAVGDLDQAHQSLTNAWTGLLSVRDRRTAGLARNVLGLVAEARGDFVQAESDFLEAIATAESTGATTEAAYARHDLGALLVNLGRETVAVPHLQAARDVWHGAGNDLLRLKSEAYLGLALMQRDRPQAAALAEAGQAAFAIAVPTGEMPQSWLWALYRLLAGLDRKDEARAVLQAAYDECLRQAAAIEDPALRRSFFERVALNQAIARELDRLVGTARTTSRSLARTGAPTGRRLTPADYVPIVWTLSAPDDSLIAVPAERRRHILQRLLAEAAAQGATPTDDDLADALNVSRRTILRDMQALARTGQPLSTRRRK